MSKYKTDPETATALKRYRAAKKRHPDMLLLVRHTDFYEAYSEDAVLLAKLLGLTLTSKAGVEMAGFPHHSLETNLRRILGEGQKVALCEEVDQEDGSKREMSRVLVPAERSPVVAAVEEKLPAILAMRTDRPQAVLPPTVGALTRLCADESARYALTGVKVMLDQPNNAFRAEATDGRVLGIIEGECYCEPADYPTVPGVLATNDATEAIVSRPGLDRAFKELPKHHVKHCLTGLALVLGQHETTLVSTDLEQTCRVTTVRNVDGRWPPVDAVFPKGKPLGSAFFDPKLLTKVCEVAAEVSHNGDGRGPVEVFFHGPDTPLVIRSVSEDRTVRFTGCIMPLTKGPKDVEAIVGKHNLKADAMKEVAPAMHDLLERITEHGRKLPKGQMRDAVDEARRLVGAINELPVADAAVEVKGEAHGKA